MPASGLLIRPTCDSGKLLKIEEMHILEDDLHIFSVCVCVSVAGLLHHVRVHLSAELRLTHTQRGSEGYFKL